MRNSFRNSSHSLNLVLVVWIFLVLGCVCGGNPNRVTNPPAPQATPQSIADLDDFKAQDSATHLKEAKKLYTKQSTRKELEAASLHLKAIPENAAEYKEAQNLTKQIEKDDKVLADKEEINKAPLVVLSAHWRKGGFNTVAVWTVTFQNKSDKPVGDITYKTHYVSETGNDVGGTGGILGDGKIQKIIPPKQKRTITINDGFVHSQADSGEFEMTGWRFVN